MDNYTPNPFITQPIYDPTRPFATPNEQLQKQIRHTTHSERYIYTQYTLYHEVDAKIQIL